MGSVPVRGSESQITAAASVAYLIRATVELEIALLAGDEQAVRERILEVGQRRAVSAGYVHEWLATQKASQG